VSAEESGRDSNHHGLPGREPRHVPPEGLPPGRWAVVRYDLFQMLDSELEYAIIAPYSRTTVRRGRKCKDHS